MGARATRLSPGDGLDDLPDTEFSSEFSPSFEGKNEMTPGFLRVFSDD